jgi:hypothetical protein
MAKAVTKDQLSDCLDRIAEYFDKDFDGATSSTAGEKGMVPAPTAGDNNKFLRGDGTWANTNSTVYVISATQPSDTSLIWIKPL